MDPINLKKNIKWFALGLVFALLVGAHYVQSQVIYPGGAGLATGDVTTNHILDGTILNADVNSSAAIAWSKISKTGSKLSDIANPDLASASGTLAIANGGTGTTTAQGAIDALLPAQTGNTGKFLTTDGTNSSWGTSNTQTFSALAGEALSIRDALRTSSGSMDVTVLETLSSTNQFEGVGQDRGGSSVLGAVYRMTFLTSGVASTTKVKFNVSKTTSEDGDLLAELRTTSGGIPTTNVMASGTLAIASITTTETEKSIAWNNAQQLAAATTYAVIFKNTGASSTTEYLKVWGTIADTYANGSSTISQDGGVSWGGNDNTQDLKLKIIDTEKTSRLYKANATSTDYSQGFVGFSEATYSAGDSVTVDIGGLVSSFSGLSPGMNYYLSQSAGLITTATSSNSMRVGVAASSTHLMILNDWQEW